MPATAPVASNLNRPPCRAHEGISHPHCAGLLFGHLGEILRGKRRARQTIAAGGWSDIKHRVAHALGRTARNLIMPQYAQRKGVYQRVTFVAFIEIHLAGHGRNAEAISVMRNAADHAAEERRTSLLSNSPNRS